MKSVTERNERNTRTHAMVLAVGLHLALGALFYVRMSSTPTTPAPQLKVQPKPQDAAATASVNTTTARP
jgi:hypothetical protein